MLLLKVPNIFNTCIYYGLINDRIILKIQFSVWLREEALFTQPPGLYIVHNIYM